MYGKQISLTTMSQFGNKAMCLLNPNVHTSTALSILHGATECRQGYHPSLVSHHVAYSGTKVICHSFFPFCSIGYAYCLGLMYKNAVVQSRSLLADRNLEKSMPNWHSDDAIIREPDMVSGSGKMQKNSLPFLTVHPQHSSHLSTYAHTHVRKTANQRRMTDSTRRHPSPIQRLYCRSKRHY